MTEAEVAFHNSIVRKLMVYQDLRKLFYFPLPYHSSDCYNMYFGHLHRRDCRNSGHKIAIKTSHGESLALDIF